MNCAIIVMAKAPLPGYAKTRLIPALGASVAAKVAHHLLVHAAKQATEARIGPVELCVSPDATHPAFSALAASLGVSIQLQGAGDLGQRMGRALARTLVAPTDRALVIGIDAPALDAQVLRLAASTLADQDAVFVPALDGGYALIGLRRPMPWLLDSMKWSTPTVMAETRRRLRAHAIRWAELGAVNDIDVPADLAHLPPEWLS